MNNSPILYRNYHIKKCEEDNSWKIVFLMRHQESEHYRRQGLFISSQQYIDQGTSGLRESIFLTKLKHQLDQIYKNRFVVRF